MSDVDDDVDVVEALRSIEAHAGTHIMASDLMHEAATEIERLRKELSDPLYIRVLKSDIEAQNGELERLRGFEEYCATASRHEIAGLRAEIARLRPPGKWSL